MNTCTICRYRFEAESPAVLFISAYGTKRVICESCEELLDKATAEEDSPEKVEAREALSNLANKMKDPEAFETLGAILAGDVSSENDPTPEEEAEMEAIFEEIRKEEEENGEEPAPPTLLDYLYPFILGGALLAFVVWFFFFR